MPAHLVRVSGVPDEADYGGPVGRKPTGQPHRDVPVSSGYRHDHRAEAIRRSLISWLHLNQGRTMPLQGEYEPSAAKWARDQVEEY